MLIKNVSSGAIIATKCDLADNFASRFLGLMFKSKLEVNGGLLITPCNSIHMFFMRFPLDIIFVDKEYTVVHLIENILPWKYSKIIWKAHSVIELPVGTINLSGTTVGDKLVLANV